MATTISHINKNIHFLKTMSNFWICRQTRSVKESYFWTLASDPTFCGSGSFICSKVMNIFVMEPNFLAQKLTFLTDLVMYILF